MPIVLTTTTFLKVGKSEISGGRYSDYYPNEARSSKQYGTPHDRLQVLILSFVYGEH